MIVVATIHWKTAVSGSFNGAANWDTATVPGANDDALIDASGTYIVTSASKSTVNSLSTIATATLSMIANAFTLAHDCTNAGALTVAAPATLLTGVAGSAFGIVNSGTINLNGKWQIPASGLALSGGGWIILGASASIESGLSGDQGGGSTGRGRLRVVAPDVSGIHRLTRYSTVSSLLRRCLPPLPALPEGATALRRPHRI